MKENQIYLVNERNILGALMHGGLLLEEAKKRIPELELPYRNEISKTHRPQNERSVGLFVCIRNVLYPYSTFMYNRKDRKTSVPLFNLSAETGDLYL